MIRPSTALVTGVSFALTALTITNAYLEKKQFYPAVVYMTKSNASLAVMYVQVVVLGYLAFQLLRKIFFGQLRAAESEHISERMWHAIMETCLAFTVFRDELSYTFALQFLLLLFVKCFHWLSEDRVDYMERSPVITISFHTRIISLLALLSAIDSYSISSAYFYSLQAGVTAQMVFGFEYAVMMTMVIHVAIKYVLHMHDLRSLHPWENKAVYLLYAELFINFIRCILYFSFAFVMWRVHAIPLFAIRPFYMTMRAFHKAMNDVILSRRAIHAMNNMFPLATEEELSQGDNTCIICREEMTVMSGAKKLPCNHIFHPNCLRSWFQRQQTCPTCRTDILAERRTGATPNQAAAGGNGPQIPGIRVNINPVGANLGGANVPPAVFPFMAHQFAFPAAQAPAAPAAGDQAAQEQPDQQGQQQQGQQQGTHMQMPPMMPPFMPPFMFPPPPPPPPFPEPPTFNGMTDEELRALEGNSRAALEARMRTIQNITCLLDAAMYQYGQYMAVTSQMPSTQNAPTGSEEAASSSNVSAEPQGLVPEPEIVPEEAAQPATTPVREEAPEPEEEQPTTSTTVIPEESNIQSSPSAPADDKLCELRQRRLARFGQNSSSSSSITDLGATSSTNVSDGAGSSSEA
uniref:E3 ubiquitin-protein ligase hrd-1 n=1 Tax=Steinernema glaseri TaxID=37863 RepID=A0A1I7Y8G8_9BILA